MSQYDDLLASAQGELDTMYERLDELADWALDTDLGAVANKIHEAMGPLRSAVEAVTQYRVGLLPLQPAIQGIEVTCSHCGAEPEQPCQGPPDSHWPAREMHSARIELAAKRDNEHRERLLAEAEELL